MRAGSLAASDITCRTTAPRCFNVLGVLWLCLSDTSRCVRCIRPLDLKPKTGLHPSVGHPSMRRGPALFALAFALVCARMAMEHQDEIKDEGKKYTWTSGTSPASGDHGRHGADAPWPASPHIGQRKHGTYRRIRWTEPVSRKWPDHGEAHRFAPAARSLGGVLGCAGPGAAERASHPSVVATASLSVVPRPLCSLPGGTTPAISGERSTSHSVRGGWSTTP
jgi:hypothetical protein